MADKKRKFRTRYETLDFNDSEVGVPGSMTDPSEYVPTEELLARFMRGEVIKAGRGNKADYEYVEGESDEQIFEDHEQQRKAESEFALIGEKELQAKKQAALKRARAQDLKDRKLKSEPKAPLPGEEDPKDPRGGKLPKGAPASPTAE